MEEITLTLQQANQDEQEKMPKAKQQKNPVQTKVIQTTIITILFTLLTGGVVYVASSQIQKISADIITKKKQVQNIQMRNTDLLATQKDVSKIGNSDTIMQDAIISSENVENFVKDIKTLAAEHKITQVTEFGTPTQSQLAQTSIPLSRIDFTLTTSTDEKTMQQFLLDFEHLPYFARISSITFNSSSSDKGWLAAGRFVLNGSVYIHDESNQKTTK